MHGNQCLFRIFRCYAEISGQKMRPGSADALQGSIDERKRVRSEDGSRGGSWVLRCLRVNLGGREIVDFHVALGSFGLEHGLDLLGDGLVDKEIMNLAFDLVKRHIALRVLLQELDDVVAELCVDRLREFAGFGELERRGGEIRDFLVDKTVSEEIQAMLKAERAKSNVKLYDFTPAKVDTKATKNPGAAPTPIL